MTWRAVVDLLLGCVGLGIVANLALCGWLIARDRREGGR
jgi:hypothetical protein